MKSRAMMMQMSVNGLTLDDFKPAMRLPPSKRVIQGIVPFLQSNKFNQITVWLEKEIDTGGELFGFYGVKAHTQVIEECLESLAVEHCLRLVGSLAMQPHQRGNQKTDHGIWK